MTFIIMIAVAYAVYRFYVNQEQAKREAKQKAEAERQRPAHHRHVRHERGLLGALWHADGRDDLLA